MQGPCRFKDLERTCEGISPSVLTARLQDLEVNGIVSRTAYREIPPRVEYALTDKGYDAVAIVEALRWYGEKWLVKTAPQPSLGWRAPQTGQNLGQNMGAALN